MAHPSKMAEIADRLLRADEATRGLPDWIAERRDVRRTYAEMADELRELTDGIVDVHGETVRRWHDHYAAAVA